VSFLAVCGAIRTAVEAAAPNFDTDRPYVFDEDANGRVVPLEELAGYRDRVCDLRVITMPRDDGEASFTTQRFRARLGLRILYQAQQDRAWVEARAADDAAVIVRALLTPSLWDSSVCTIAPPEDPTWEERRGGNPVPQLVGLILTIPFDVVYLSP